MIQISTALKIASWLLVVLAVFTLGLWQLSSLAPICESGWHWGNHPVAGYSCILDR